MESSDLNRADDARPEESRTGGSEPPGWLYALVLLLALGLRLIRLGALPLTDLEAAPALQAFELAQGLKPVIDPQPAYILFSAPLFFAYGGATNYLARLVPALAGSFMVLVPWFFRQRLGSRAALLLALLLAVDPGLLALSRQAASSILALTFLLFAWAFWEQARPLPAGVFAGLALLGGPAIWGALLVFGLAWGISRLMQTGRAPADADSERRRNELLRSALPPALITLVIAGTLFMLAPGGLAAALASIPAYLRGWISPSGVPPTRLILALLFYQPLTLILAFTALLRGWRAGDRTVMALGLWMSVAFLVAALYPAHRVTDLYLALVPLCALAALELVRHFDLQPEERTEVGGVMVLTALILIFAWLDLASLMYIPVPSSEATVRIGLFFGSLVLLAVSLLLVAFGWSVRAAQRGGLYGALIALGIYSFGAGLAAGGLRAQPTPEMWSPGNYPAQAELLSETINDLSDWNAGYVNSLPVTITSVDSPALLWVLRNYQVSRANTLDMTSAPPLVITSLAGDPSLAASYRGQDFAWGDQLEWEGRQFPQLWDAINHWLRWLILREMPHSSETILLWARDDLFLDTAAFP